MSSLYDATGRRKYLTISERCAFLEVSRSAAAEVYTFCLTLAYTGARLSEVLALTPRNVDFEAQLIVLESLKKRRRGMFRAVPVPAAMLDELERVHSLTATQQSPSLISERLWPWCRTTAWARVKECMAAAHVVGCHTSPKALRHGFAVSALQSGVPINLVKRWLGHSRLSTTEIYADAIGDEERSIAQRFWRSF